MPRECGAAPTQLRFAAAPWRRRSLPLTTTAPGIAERSGLSVNWRTGPRPSICRGAGFAGAAAGAVAFAAVPLGAGAGAAWAAAFAVGLGLLRTGAGFAAAAGFVGAAGAARLATGAVKC
ncbi:MAG: hypothetical protein ACK56I_17985, partial [bacterium]